MMEHIFNWLINNWVEVSGAVLGIIYIFLSVKQNILTWLLGLLTSLLYIYVFFKTGFYADMALQFYYVWVSIYGWIIWAKGKNTAAGREELPVTHINRTLAFILLPIFILLWVLIWFILKEFTNSPVPVGDSFTTALSIVATWMLARKVLEHWILWVVVDAVSLALYIYKDLYPTAILFVVYTVAAVWGYVEWKKDMMKQSDA